MQEIAAQEERVLPMVDIDMQNELHSLYHYPEFDLLMRSSDILYTPDRDEISIRNMSVSYAASQLLKLLRTKENAKGKPLVICLSTKAFVDNSEGFEFVVYDGNKYSQWYITEWGKVLDSDENFYARIPKGEEEPDLKQHYYWMINYDDNVMRDYRYVTLELKSNLTFDKYGYVKRVSSPVEFENIASADAADYIAHHIIPELGIKQGCDTLIIMREGSGLVEEQEAYIYSIVRGYSSNIYMNGSLDIVLRVAITRQGKIYTYQPNWEKIGKVETLLLPEMTMEDADDEFSEVQESEKEDYLFARLMVLLGVLPMTKYQYYPEYHLKIEDKSHPDYQMDEASYDSEASKFVRNVAENLNKWFKSRPKVPYQKKLELDTGGIHRELVSLNALPDINDTRRRDRLIIYRGSLEEDGKKYYRFAIGDLISVSLVEKMNNASWEEEAEKIEDEILVTADGEIYRYQRGMKFYGEYPQSWKVRSFDPKSEVEPDRISMRDYYECWDKKFIWIRLSDDYEDNRLARIAQIAGDIYDNLDMFYRGNETSALSPWYFRKAAAGEPDGESSVEIIAGQVLGGKYYPRFRVAVKPNNDVYLIEGGTLRFVVNVSEAQKEEVRSKSQSGVNSEDIDRMAAAISSALANDKSSDKAGKSDGTAATPSSEAAEGAEPSTKNVTSAGTSEVAEPSAETAQHDGAAKAEDAKTEPKGNDVILAAPQGAKTLNAVYVPNGHGFQIPESVSNANMNKERGVTRYSLFDYYWPVQSDLKLRGMDPVASATYIATDILPSIQKFRNYNTGIQVIGAAKDPFIKKDGMYLVSLPVPEDYDNVFRTGYKKEYFFVDRGRNVYYIEKRYELIKDMEKSSHVLGSIKQYVKCNYHEQLWNRQQYIKLCVVRYYPLIGLKVSTIKGYYDFDDLIKRAALEIESNYLRDYNDGQWTILFAHADKIGDKNAYVYYVYHGDGDCWFYAAVSEDHKLYRYYYDAVRIGHVPSVVSELPLLSNSIDPLKDDRDYHYYDIAILAVPYSVSDGDMVSVKLAGKWISELIIRRYDGPATLLPWWIVPLKVIQVDGVDAYEFDVGKGKYELTEVLFKAIVTQDRRVYRVLGDNREFVGVIPDDAVEVR